MLQEHSHVLLAVKKHDGDFSPPGLGDDHGKVRKLVAEVKTGRKAEADHGEAACALLTCVVQDRKVARCRASAGKKIA